MNDEICRMCHEPIIVIGAHGEYHWEHVETTTFDHSVRAMRPAYPDLFNFEPQSDEVTPDEEAAAIASILRGLP